MKDFGKSNPQTHTAPCFCSHECDQGRIGSVDKTPRVVITLDGQSHHILSLETTGQCAGPAAGTPLQHHASFTLSSAVRLSSTYNCKKAIWNLTKRTWRHFYSLQTITEINDTHRLLLESSFWAYIASPVHIWTGVTDQLCIKNTPNEEEWILFFNTMCRYLLCINYSAFDLNAQLKNTLVKLPTCKQTLNKDDRPLRTITNMYIKNILSVKSFTNTYVVIMKRHANMLATCRLK